MRKRAGEGERQDCRAAEPKRPENDAGPALMGDGEGPRQLRGDKADGHEIESPGCVAVGFESGDGCFLLSAPARAALCLWLSGVRGWRGGCRSDWRAHCVDGGGAGSWQPAASSERDGRDRLVATRRCYMRLNRAAGWLGGAGGRRRGPGTGGPAKRVPVLGRQPI